ncbi:DUF2726 domain-containing protein [Petrachloros mirabilis]
MAEAFSPISRTASELWFIGLIAISLAFLLWRVLVARSSKPRRPEPFTLPSGATLKPQTFLTDRELLLYNLLRMAVQDRYLVFAQVPLWTIIAVEADDVLRRAVLRRLALKRADFVLVHPGSREVEHVVQLEEDTPYDESRDTPGQEIQLALQAAGIRVTILKRHTNYTLHELQQLLETGETE